jgi:cell division protein FtsW (lipid II flippase)
VIKIFPVRAQASEKDRLQSQLMILAALVLVAYAVIQTLAPSVRYQSTTLPLPFEHWLGVIVWLIVFSFLHRQVSKKIPNRDPYLLPIVALLTGTGLMMIWRLYPSMGFRQTIWLAICGLIVWLGLQFPGYLTQLHRYKYIWLVLGLLLTGMTFLFGENPGGDGPALWLQVFGLHFQPSEPLKLLLVVYLAGYFADRMTVQFKGLQAILPTLIAIGLALVLLVSQKDLGSAVIFLFIYLSMLFVINGNRWILWTAPLFMILAAVAGYFLIGVVRVRLTAWLNPFGDPQGISYQVIQSMIAIAEGSLIGTGPGLGSPGVIPVSVSDFIFAAITEETGFLGALVIILLFIFLVYRASRTALHAKTPFDRYMAMGIGMYFGIQSVLIIGGNIGLLPLTGVTLPFVSYGGSSLVISFAALLILLTISQDAQDDRETKEPVRSPRLALTSTVLILVLTLEILITSLQGFWFRADLVDRAENPRWFIADRFVKRGDILDRSNSILATTTGANGAITRVVNYNELSPILGYTSAIYGQTGIESAMYPYLRGLEGYPENTILQQDILNNQPPEGLNVRLTLDMTYQYLADDSLGESPGSAILMNAETGEILAMASHPYFNPATLEDDWSELASDETAPLFNRATQGVYPTGAALFPFVLTTRMTDVITNPNPKDLLSGSQLLTNCAAYPYGELTWQSLVSNGCLNAMEALAEPVDSNAIAAMIRDFGFTTPPALHLPVADVEPQVGIADLSVSPLQMALAASALTYEGTLPAPRIVNGYQDPKAEWITLPKLGVDGQATNQTTASRLTDLLKVEGTSRWQVTATSTTQEDEPVTWFIAGTTSEWLGQPLVVVIVLEEDNPQRAETIGVTLLEQTALGLGN